MRVTEDLVPGNNATDVVKVLLVYALRHGAVEPTTLEQCLATARSRPDKKITWTHPEYPLCPGWTPGGRTVEPSKPASPRTQSVRSSFAVAMRCAGLLQPSRPPTIFGRSLLELRKVAYTGMPNNLCSQILSSRDEFVSFFAAINVARDDKKTQPPSTSGSRDQPSAFQYLCPNHNMGCSFSTATYGVMMMHHRGCKMTSRAVYESILEDQAARKFVCSKCDAAFHDRAALNNHMKHIHEPWQPQKCELCDSDRVFTTRRTYLDHKVSYHSPWKPSQCPIRGCRFDNFLNTAKTMHLHLIKHHWTLTKEQKAGLMRALRERQAELINATQISREDLTLDLPLSFSPESQDDRLNRVQGKVARLAGP